jgi:hypothetical protein
VVNAAADVPLKAPSAWKLIGRPLARLDTAPKINGSLLYFKKGYFVKLFRTLYIFC